MDNAQQARLLWTLAYSFEPSSKAHHSLYCEAFHSKQSYKAFQRELQSLVDMQLVEDYGESEYELAMAGIEWLLRFESDSPSKIISLLDRCFDATDEVGPFAQLLKYLLTGRWYMHAPIVTPDSQQVFRDFCRSPYAWLSMQSLSKARCELLGFAGWFEMVNAANGNLANKIMLLMQKHELRLAELVKPDRQLLESDANLAPAVQHQVYTPDNTQTLFTGRRYTSMSANLSSLFDIAAVALYHDELAESLAENYYQQAVRAEFSAGFVSGALISTIQLTISPSDYPLVFGEPQLWLERLVVDVDESMVCWGELLLNLCMLFRWERLEPGTQQRFAAAIASLPQTQQILNFIPQNLLQQRAQLAFKQLLDPTQQGFFEQPSAWQSWLRIATGGAAETSSPVVGQERLVWMLHDDLSGMNAKIQKQGKKGWSKGRSVDPEDLIYRYEELLSTQDRNIAMLAVGSRERWGFYRYNDITINVPIAQQLEQSERVFDSNGEPLTIYRSHPLVVIREQQGKLSPESYPELSEQPLSYNEFGAVILNDFSDSASRLLEAMQAFPPGIELEQLSELQAMLAQCKGLSWYNAINDEGNIKQLAWHPQPQLCLSWKDNELAVSIITRPSEANQQRFQHLAGKGPGWIYNSLEQGWYQRDLAAEQKAAKHLVKQLPLRASKKLHWQLAFEDALAFIEQLSAIEPAPAALFWQGKTKLRLLSQQQLALDVTRKQDWFSISGSSQVDKDLELELRTLLAGSKQRLLKLENGDTLVLSKSLRRQLQLLDSVLNEDLEVDQRMAYPLAQLFEGMQHSGDAAWQSLVDGWREKPELDVAHLQPLRDYQHSSVAWAAHLSHHQFGACLADDMGLGKTLQALTLLRHYAAHGPALVVMPKSVLHNWQSEAARFAPELQIVDLEASDNRAQTIADAAPHQVLLISYGLVTRQAAALAEVEWQSVVLDEAQNIKNPTTKRAKAVFGLQAKVRLALTGTPIENHLIELWSLFNFINPGLLGARSTFLKTYGKASENEEDLARLRALVSPFIMRRTKGEVLQELPAKTEITHKIELSSKQRTAYEAVRKQVMTDVKSGKGLVEVLSAMTRLRQVCCDPRLVFEHMQEPGGKLDEALVLILDALENGHRILVFSQFVQLLKNLAALLEQHSLNYSYLDGQSSSAKRKQAIEQFKQGDTELFLISLKAGGTGLNLTEADMVIHLDPWWNPAVEDQASDRAHRMGQTKPVTVYRLVAENSIEEKIIELHREKRDLADKILSGQSQGSALSPEMLLGLLTDSET